MTSIQFRSRIDANGVLHITLPIGRHEADREVRVTVEPLDEFSLPMTADQWHRFVHEMAGSIDDPTFERHSQGEFEQREDLFR